ncbi:hypothetical protein GCM10008983_19250 [Lentibacillus halophilus]|uniref:LysM domain-containing protein n=1 Tax=Lentibacillus halophilus TaxID=295065 RepID=A0ABN0ZCG4_9BACI
MENDRNVFRFELNESLFFARGQEVSDMMGVSLDPEISIDSFSDYISIRGVIELNGTYQKETIDVDETEDPYDVDDDHARKYMERVNDIDDNQAEFTHRFPVEISVPANRVTDLDDVTVGIESLDYEIPDEQQLKLNAVIGIHGIADEVDVTDGASSEVDSSSPPRDDETFAFDIKMENEEENTSETLHDSETAPIWPEGSVEESNQESVVEDIGNDVQGTADDVQDNEDNAQDTGDDTVKKDDDTPNEKDRWKGKKTQTLAEFFGTENKKTSGDDSVEADETDGQDDNQENVDESPSLATISETADVDEQGESTDAIVSDAEDVRYLADMFRRDEEESFAKMRLCIVQETDTVESIAERYGISALQLLRQNHLGEESLEEGQLLYIPS